MADYDNSNTFVLFKNDKGDNEKRPDYRGTVDIDGTEYQISGWIRTPKAGGSKFISGPVELKEAVAAGSDDDVPF